MQLKVIGTGSAGNCYILENEDTALIIEAGISFKEVKKALGFNIRKIVGLVITHEHGDHSKYIKEYLNSGIKVFVNESTNMLFNGVNSFLPMLYDNEHMFCIDNFKITPFELKHDVECHGFQIDHNEIGRLIFITDTNFSPYTFENVNHWVIECNHSRKILEEKILEGKIELFLMDKVSKNHMSIETLIDLFDSNDTSKTKNIVLIHGSDSNSHSVDFKQKIIDCTGKITYIAEKGLIVNLNTI